MTTNDTTVEQTTQSFDQLSLHQKSLALAALKRQHEQATAMLRAAEAVVVEELRTQFVESGSKTSVIALPTGETLGTIGLQDEQDKPFVADRAAFEEFVAETIGDDAFETIVQVRARTLESILEQVRWIEDPEFVAPEGAEPGSPQARAPYVAVYAEGHKRAGTIVPGLALKQAPRIPERWTGIKWKAASKAKGRVVKETADGQVRDGRALIDEFLSTSPGELTASLQLLSQGVETYA